MSKKTPSPNDQRANTLNPNNPAHRAAQNNRANQLNPNNPAYHAARTGGGDRPARPAPRGGQG